MFFDVIPVSLPRISGQLATYRLQFLLMQMHELADEYDARGRQLLNTVRKTSYRSFTKIDREEDY